LPEVLLIDEKTRRLGGINIVIGCRLQEAFGDSIGYQQVVEYTSAVDTRPKVQRHADLAKQLQNPEHCGFESRT
jgi:hypothetical protein